MRNEESGGFMDFWHVALMLALPVFAAAQDTIKIGATEPLSGTFKDIGERYLEGCSVCRQSHQ